MVCCPLFILFATLFLRFSSYLNVNLLTGSVNIVIFEAKYLHLIKLGGIKCSREVALCPPIAVSFFNLFNITEVYIAQDTYIKKRKQIQLMI